MKDDRLYLVHIGECISRIRRYTTNGEAASRISSATTALPPLPWREMKALRNVLIHQYSGVDLRSVWKVVADDIPPLADQVATLLGQRPQP